jgi:hypothetical protein
VEAYQMYSNYVAIFDSGIFEKTEIPWTDFDSKTLELVLEFIYTQKIQKYPNDEESLLELLRISKICKITNLIEILSLKLIEFLKFSNSLKMIEYCVEFDIHNYLEKKAWDILKNSSKDDLIHSNIFLILSLKSFWKIN